MPRLSLLLTALLLVACQSGTEPTEPCVGAKCDDPGSTADRECREMCGGDSECFATCREEAALDHCKARRDDAINSAQRAFVRDAIRWSCSDVEGVNTNGNDDRGQEYCEYFAVVQPPPETEGGDTPEAAVLGRGSRLGLELTEDQIFALEDEPSAVVGQCLFTSWHQDIGTELPLCAEGKCPELAVGDGATLPSWAGGERGLGYELTAANAKMQISINSNGAAVDLLEKCMASPPEITDAEDPRNDHYIRGCMGAFDLFRTEWRRSDPTICTAAMRLSECGCGVDTDGDGVADITDVNDVARGLVPRQPQDGEVTLRGFRLGTWGDADGLPGGCRYVEDGEGTKTLVACDLTGADLLAAAGDPKDRCREKYGDNVVVHIPIPADAVVCTPDPERQFTDTCGDNPWVVGDEGQSGSGGGEECCRVCTDSQPCGDSCISNDLTCNQPPGCACTPEEAGA
jgi:hypothetical protein